MSLRRGGRVSGPGAAIAMAVAVAVAAAIAAIAAPGSAPVESHPEPPQATPPAGSPAAPAARSAADSAAAQPAPPSTEGPVGSSPQLVDRVVAMVDEEPILLSDLEREVESYKFDAEASGQKVDADPAQLRKQMLDRLIEVKLLVAQAKLDGITLGDQELEQAVSRSMDDMITRFGSRRNLERELERSRMTYGDLEARNRELIRNRLYTSRIVATHIRPLVEVRADEVRKYYEDHKDQVPRRPARVKLANVLVVPQPSEQAQVVIKDALAKIQADLGKGVAFEDVARSYSQDANATGGGHLGTFAKGDLFNGLLEDAAWSQPVGVVGQPITTEIGVHLLRVDSRTNDEVTLSQIMLRLTITDPERERAAARAKEVAALAAQGRDFAELARMYSDDPTSREKGGELGEFAVDQLTPQFREALRDLPVGGVADPVKGAAGYFVLKLLDRTEARTPSFEEVAPQLHDVVQDQKIEAELQKFLAGLRSKFYIDVKS
jgi:peptidyl-prolyl cis-trans isomerase SurA